MSWESKPVVPIVLDVEAFLSVSLQSINKSIIACCLELDIPRSSLLRDRESISWVAVLSSATTLELPLIQYPNSVEVSFIRHAILKACRFHRNMARKTSELAKAPEVSHFSSTLTE